MSFGPVTRTWAVRDSEGRYLTAQYRHQEPPRYFFHVKDMAYRFPLDVAKMFATMYGGRVEEWKS